MLFAVRNKGKDSLGKRNSENKGMVMWKHVVHFDVTVQYSVITEKDVHQSQFPNSNTRPPYHLIFCSLDIITLSYVMLSKCNWNRLHCVFKKNARQIFENMIN